MDPLTGEWVTVAPNRSNRPVLPEKCPFCPGSSEIDPSLDVQIIQNRFPPYTPVSSGGTPPFSVPAYGVSEIVVESLDHNSDFSEFNLGHALKVVRVTLDRMRHLQEEPGIKYVHFFRNRGRSGSVSITHPHSQILALPFVPPRLAKEAERLNTQTCALCGVDKLPSYNKRVVFSRNGAIMYVPYAPRTPYEIMIQTKHTRNLWDLDSSSITDLVYVLLLALKLLDRTLGDETAYTLTFHNSPRGAQDFHAHIELIPVITDRRRVRFSRGLERSSGSYLLDALPEDKAQELKANLEDLLPPHQ
ncbi:MAG: hypothetical protein QW514_01735 [Thermoprotei archaeon]